MTIEEMQALKTAMESRLARVAGEVVSEFQRRSGMGVDSVNVYLVSTQAIGQRPESVVSNVEISVRL